MEHKIGEILEITDDFEIKTAISEKTLQVKKGDIGYIDSNGCMHYLSGDAKGKIQKIDDVKPKGYDYESIANLIFKKLNTEYDLKEALQGYGIDEKDFLEQIEDILSDIL